jgi:hypothetical protein
MINRLGVFFILSAFFSACSVQKFELSPNQTTSIPTYEGTSHFVFWGLGQVKNLYPAEVCGSSTVTSVETKDSFVNGLLTGLTYGIYSPRDYAVYCNRK